MISKGRRVKKGDGNFVSELHGFSLAYKLVIPVIDANRINFLHFGTKSNSGWQQPQKNKLLHQRNISETVANTYPKSSFYALAILFRGRIHLQPFSLPYPYFSPFRCAVRALKFLFSPTTNKNQFAHHLWGDPIPDIDVQSCAEQ